MEVDVSFEDEEEDENLVFLVDELLEGLVRLIVEGGSSEEELVGLLWSLVLKMVVGGSGSNRKLILVQASR